MKTKVEQVEESFCVLQNEVNILESNLKSINDKKIKYSEHKMNWLKSRLTSFLGEKIEKRQYLNSKTLAIIDEGNFVSSLRTIF